MTRTSMLVGAVAAVVLSGCASTSGTVGYCRNSSICPIVIYETYPGVFAAIPDRMSITSGKPLNNVTLVWTFADQSKYKFSTKTDNLVDDGVELIDKNGATIGMHPCFITNDSREAAQYAREGAYLRCEITDGAAFAAVRYRVRFHGVDGSTKVVDPTVDSSGGGDHGGGAAAAAVPVASAPVYQTVKVDVGNPVALPLIGNSDGVKVIWNAGAGNFIEREHPMLFKDAAGKDVNFQPCRTTSDAGGNTPSASGPFYMCLITTAADKISVKYTASFKESGLSQVKTNDMTRP